MSQKPAILKVSGKKFEIGKTKPTSWTFESRPGGWVIAKNPEGERYRIALHQFRGKLSFSSLRSSGLGEIQAVAAGSVSGAATKASVDADLTAQFPGKVRKILVQPGAQVLEGEPLLLVEAMKMEFAIKAPTNGKVKKLFVIEGQQLSPGDRFLDFEILEKK